MPAQYRAQKLGAAEERAAPRSETIWICIPTKARPLQLERLIYQLAPSINKSVGHEVKVVISDDASDAQDTVDSGLVRSLEDSTGREVRLLALSDKRALVTEIAAIAGVSDATVGFAVFGPAEGGCPTYGGNQNAIMMSAPGAIRISIDDDIVWKPMRRGGDTHSGESGEFASYYPGEEALQADLCLTEVEPFDQMLGAFSKASDARSIALVTPGLYGDPATTSNHAVALARNRSTSRAALASSEAYVSARFGRCAIRQSIDRRIEPIGGFMTAVFALDGRLEFPPFFPILRGSDRAFGNLTNALHPTYDRCYLPWSLGHRPDTDRTDGSLGAFWRTCDLLDGLQHSFSIAYRFEQVTPSLADFGRFLLHLTRAESDQAFSAQLSQMRNRLFNSYRQQVLNAISADQTIQKYAAPDLTRQLIYLDLLESKQEVAIPHDWRPLETPASRVQGLRRALADYGDLCVAWRAIMRAAEERLADEGSKVT